jgi:hypothetical protein
MVGLAGTLQGIIGITPRLKRNMESHVQLIQKAFELRKNQQIREALAIYNDLWNLDPDIFGEWDGWSYGVCLSKNGQHREALDICRFFYRRNKESPFINHLYARNIYYSQFVVTPLPPLPVLRKATRAMLLLSPPDQEHSLTVRAIFRLVRTLTSGQVIDWKEIGDWLQLLDPDQLSDQPFEFRNERGKVMEFASPLEEWYSAMIKVKAGLGDPEGLLDLVEAARNRQLKWHYNNDIWFARKEAFALLSLGRREEGEKILRDIVRQKQDWFLIADLAGALDSPAEALRLRCQAAMMPTGDLSLKVRLFHQIYQAVAGHDDQKSQCRDLLELIAGLRREKGWEIPLDLQAVLSDQEIDPAALPPARKIFSRLLPFFRKMMYLGRKTRTGAITAVREKPRHGHITGEDGHHYFFRFQEALMPARLIHEGRKVRFETEPGFDKKRQITTQTAVRITPWGDQAGKSKNGLQ